MDSNQVPVVTSPSSPKGLDGHLQLMDIPFWQKNSLQWQSEIYLSNNTWCNGAGRTHPLMGGRARPTPRPFGRQARGSWVHASTPATRSSAPPSNSCRSFYNLCLRDTYEDRLRSRLRSRLRPSPCSLTGPRPGWYSPQPWLKNRQSLPSPSCCTTPPWSAGPCTSGGPARDRPRRNPPQKDPG